MSAELSAARVLLIAPRFFGYEQEIVNELARFGKHVDFLPDRPFNSPLMKAILRFRPELGGHHACDRFFSERLEELGRSEYETIVVIQGEGVTRNTLIRFRNMYPQARLVYHTWDSIENKPFSKKNISLYDRCSTFDPTDAKKYGLIFRPLFYSNGFSQQTDCEVNYDLSFIGTAHSDRYKIINNLLNQLPPETKSFIYLYLQAPWMYDLRRVFTRTIKGARRDDFCYLPLGKEKVQSVFLGSRAILDIEHVQQKGATIRTMEVLGSKRKLVTTNSTLLDYDFYNPENIHIISRKAPKLDLDFLRKPYQPIPEAVRKNYSIHQWAADVCGYEGNASKFSNN